MLEVEEIKPAITLLPPSELVDFSVWFKNFEAQVWDTQIEEDIKGVGMGLRPACASTQTGAPQRMKIISVLRVCP